MNSSCSENQTREEIRVECLVRLYKHHLLSLIFIKSLSMATIFKKILFRKKKSSVLIESVPVYDPNTRKHY